MLALLVLVRIIDFANVRKFDDKTARHSNKTEESNFADAMDFQCLTREKSLKIGLDFLQEDNNDHESKSHLLRLFNSLMRGDIDLCNRFVKKSKSAIHIPVPTHVHPSQKIKFLCHIVMTMGCISSELETLRSNNMSDASRVARTVNDEERTNEIIEKNTEIIKIE